jgi:hypothetical protein
MVWRLLAAGEKRLDAVSLDPTSAGAHTHPLTDTLPRRPTHPPP